MSIVTFCVRKFCVTLKLVKPCKKVRGTYLHSKSEKAVDGNEPCKLKDSNETYFKNIGKPSYSFAGPPECRDKLKYVEGIILSSPPHSGAPPS